MKTFIKMLKNRIKSTAAFTIAEVLVAIIILLLVSGIVAAGIPAAINAYNNVVLSANAEMLRSTAMAALRNELGTADDITIIGATSTEDDGVKTGTGINYYSEATGWYSEITNDSSQGIMYQRYASSELIEDAMGPDDSDPVRLVSEEASDKEKGLYITYEDVSYDRNNGVVTFSNLEVHNKKGKVIPKTTDYYSVRVMTAD